MSLIPGTTTGNDTLTGTTLDDTIIGDAGNDVLSGLAGDDSITGDAGADTITGGAGADTLEGGADNDTFMLSGGFGVDTIIGGAGADTAVFSGGANSTFIRLDADAGVEQINMSNATLSGTSAEDRFDFSGVTTVTNRGRIDLLAGDDRFTGSQAADSVVGGAGNDTLSGGAGNDTLDGGEGSDSLLGGDGDDRLVSTGAELFTRFSGGAGSDTLALVGSGGATSIKNLKLDAAASIETIAFETGGGLGGTAGRDNFNLSGVATLVNGAVINMGADKDVFVGSQAADAVNGGDGADSLDGGTGDDTLEGGSGVDTLLGGDGADRFVSTGVEGSTSFKGGAGADTLAFVGSAEGASTFTRLTLDAAASVETLRFETGGGLGGTAGADTFRLGGVTTVVNGQTIDLKAGADSFIGTQAADTVLGGDGRDKLDGSDGADSLMGGADSDTLTGGDGADTLDGGAGADKLTGGAGDDVLITSGDDTGSTFSGGAGADTLVFLQAAGVGTSLAGLTLNAAASIETMDLTVGSLSGTAAVNRFDLSGVTTVIAAKSIALLAGNDSFIGSQAADIVDGGSGSDTLDGGLGADSLTGGTGNDTFVVDNAGDTLVEAASGGTDSVLSSISYTLAAQIEKLTLTGSSAINATGNALANTLTGNAGANVLDGGAGVDVMTGGAGNDTYVVDDVRDRVTESSGAANGVDLVQSSASYVLGLNVENLTLTGTAAINATGNALDNVLTGNAGANTLDGDSGADTMAGGAGDDVYVVRDAGDVVTEGANAGVDTVKSWLSYSLTGNVDNLTLLGSATDGTGNSLANVLTGNSRANVLNGNAGADTMAGGSGSDVYTVDNVGDVVTETGVSGTDIVQSSVSFTLGAYVENLTLTGSGGLSGTGNTLRNVIVGNAGANDLDGGLGSDALTGGAGADNFVFSTTLGSANVDKITDFTVADDTIKLDDAVFVGLTAGVLDVGALALGTAALDADDRIIYDAGTGSLFFDRDGLGGAKAVKFATLGEGLVLTNADFDVI
jgi:Ca2+-binding RTX toxin-like protein